MGERIADIFSTKVMKQGLFRILLLSVLFTISPDASGQYSDFRSWWSVDLNKRLTNDLDAGLEIGQRFYENSLKYDRTLATISLKYDLINNLAIAGGYRFILTRDKRMNMMTKARLHLSATYKYDIASFSFGIREQLQYGYDDFEEIDVYYNNNFRSRTRGIVKYDIFGLPLAVYASYEYFLDLNDPYGIVHSETRIKTGIEYTISFKSELDISYMHNTEFNTQYPLRSNLLVVTFAYNL